MSANAKPDIPKKKRVTEIEVEGLFGKFHHRVPLNLDDRITIIHGPNGFGKTTLLRMVGALFDGRPVQDVPYDQLIIKFSDSTERRVRPGEGNTTAITDGSKGLVYTGIRYKVMTHEFVDGLERLFDSAPGGEVKEIHLPLNRLTTATTDEDGEEAGSCATVTLLASRTSAIIEKKLAESADFAQSLERSFPARVVERMRSNDVSDAEFPERLSALNARRQRLRDVGIFGGGDEHLDPPNLDVDEAKGFLDVYLEDAERRLSFFDDLESRLRLFRTIINNRFLLKQMTLSKSDGFQFTDDQGNVMPLVGLSSGEQHLIVLFFSLLFEVEPNTLVLIDEPELSLHVSWQDNFLKDLQKIARLSEIDILMATHSPDIIADRWDLTVELGWPDEDAHKSAA